MNSEQSSAASPNGTFRRSWDILLFNFLGCLGDLCALARAIPLIQPDNTKNRNLLKSSKLIKFFSSFFGSAGLSGRS
jgi:hypothetical protein